MSDVKSISAQVPDWSREESPRFSWDPGRALLASIRSWETARLRAWPVRRMIRLVAVFRHRLWSIATGADIPLNSNIGGGLLLPHPNGIVIHPKATIGPNCLIFQQVTIGEAKGGVPTIGGHVDIGAGAKLLGAITVGDHACIGANAVVLVDVPEGATAVGCPARIILPPLVSGCTCV